MVYWQDYAKRFAQYDRRRTRPGSGNRRAVWGIALYTVLLLAIAFWSGFRLFGWARDRIGASLPERRQYGPVAGLAGSPAMQTDAAVQGSETAPEEAAPIPRTPPINVLLLGTDERPAGGRTRSAQTPSS